MTEVLNALSTVLWGPGTPPKLTRGLRRQAEAYFVLPNARHPRLLVPAVSNGLAQSGLRTYAPTRPRARVAFAAGRFALNTRAGLRWTQLAIGTLQRPATARDADSLRSMLRCAAGDRSLELALSLDSNRPHWKPAVRLLSPDGELRAFAKLAWNRHTAALVSAEAVAMKRLGSRQFRTFRIPKLMAEVAVRSRPTLLFEPMPGHTPVAPTASAFPLDAFRELSHSAASEPGTQLRSSAYWLRVTARVADVSRADSELDVSALFRRVQESIGASPLLFGPTHGDWVPWNMGYDSSGTLWIWDWERFSTRGPIGQDAAQFVIQTHLYGTGDRPDHDAILAEVARIGGLVDIVDPTWARRVVTLTLLESILRRLEARAEGATIARNRPYLEMLERLLV
jgi:hypothetical protein